MLINVISIDADWLEKKGLLEDALDDEEAFALILKGEAPNPVKVQPIKKWVDKEFVIEEPEKVCVAILQSEAWPAWWAEMVAKRGEPAISGGYAIFNEPCY